MNDSIVTLTYGKIAHLDATTGPTDWAGRSIELERRMGMEGYAPTPPSESRRPGQIVATGALDATTGATVDAMTSATTSTAADACAEAAADATTSATVDATTSASIDATTSATFAAEKASAEEDFRKTDEQAFERCGVSKDFPDATTGATPGVSAACKELGMASLSDVIADMGIKPPGQA